MSEPTTQRSGPEMERRGRIGLVPARFGPGMVGGAEIVMAEIAQGLKARGWDVEILTTCAKDHFSWRNELPAGLTEEDGLAVRRFPVVMEDIAERGVLEHAIVERRLEIETQWRVLIPLAVVVYVGLRSLKRHTTILAEAGR